MSPSRSTGGFRLQVPDLATCGYFTFFKRWEMFFIFSINRFLHGVGFFHGPEIGCLYNEIGLEVTFITTVKNRKAQICPALGLQLVVSFLLFNLVQQHDVTVHLAAALCQCFSFWPESTGYYVLYICLIVRSREPAQTAGSSLKTAFSCGHNFSIQM